MISEEAVIALVCFMAGFVLHWVLARHFPGW